MSSGPERLDDPLDRSVLTGLRELQESGEPDIVADVGRLFIKHAPQKLAAMKKAVADGDARALEAASHNLKSSSSYIGAMRLSELAKELEYMGRNGTLEGTLERVATAVAEFERVKGAIEAEIE